MGYGDFSCSIFWFSREILSSDWKKYRSETFEKQKKIVQENWICVCRTYVLEDNFTFYFWQKFLLKMIWLELSSLCNDLTSFVCQKEKFYNLCIVKTQPRQQLCTVHFRKDLLCQTFMQYLQQKVCFSGQILKVRQFQNEFVKSSFLPKYEQKIVRTSALWSEGRNLDNSLFVFWEKRWLQKFILKLTDL